MKNNRTSVLTVKLDPLLDARLKHEAYVANLSQEELMRRYIQVGIDAVDGKSASPSKTTP